MEEAVDFIFKDLKIMIDGMLPSAMENSDDHDHLKTNVPEEKEIIKCFDDLRTVINKIKIPVSDSW